MSIRDRKKNLDLTGDPWDGRTLEWATHSPVPFYNFAITPIANERDSFWEDKERARKANKPASKPTYTDIHMPRNTSIGFLIAAFSMVLGFAMIWDITWLAVVGGVGILASIISRSFDYNIDYYVKAEEVEKIENEYANRVSA